MLPNTFHLFFRALALIVAAHLVMPPHLWATFRDLTPDNFFVEWNEEAQFRSRDWHQVSQEFSSQLQAAFAQAGKAQAPIDQQRRWHSLEEDLLGGHHDLKRMPLDAFSLSLIAARRAYFALELPQCLQHVRTAQDLLHQKPSDGFWETGLAFQIFLIEGVCKLASQDARGADAAFQKALALRPKEYLSEVTFSPQVIEAYEAARAAFLAQHPFSDQASLSLSSSPPFADVFLNGEYVGQTPLALADVYAGEHFIQLKQRGFVSWFSRVQVQPRAGMRLNAAMKPLVWTSSSDAFAASSEKSPEPFQWVSTGQGDPQALADLKQLAGLLQVSQMTLITLSPKGLDYSARVRVFDQKRNAFMDEVVVDLVPVKEAMGEAVRQVLQALHFPQEPVIVAERVEPGPQEALRESEETQLLTGVEVAGAQRNATQPAAATTGLAFEEVQTPAPSLDQGPSTEDMARLKAADTASRPVYRRWWFWTLVAVAAAGAGAGAAYAFGQGGGGQGGSTPGMAVGAAANGVIVGQQRR